MKKRFRKVTAVLIAIVMTMLMIPMTAMSVNASQKDDIVSIARSQIGYKGRPNDYTRFTGSLYINGGWTTSYDWCASFVSWCANQAGVSTDVIPKHTSCTIGMNWFKDRNLWQDSKAYGGNYTPKAGDIVYFSDSHSQYNSSHVGIVAGTNGDYLDTIEGNTDGNKVSEYTANSKRTQSNLYVLGYGTPQYNDEPIIEDHENPTYDNVYLSNITDTSFRVCAVPRDNIGIRNVSIVVWTAQDGQDDMILYNATNDGNGTFYVDVNKSNHSPIDNPQYIIHIHAYDFAGNDALYPTSLDYGDKELPTYDNVGFTNITNDSFRVYATPKDNSGIRNVSIVV